MRNKNLSIIGISGGSCSGKTFLANKILKKYGASIISIINLDSYYFDLSLLSMKNREKNNFDHPSSFDFKQLELDLIALKNYQNINIPQYDYTTHTRKKETKTIRQTKIILLEGILSLYIKNIRNLMDIKIYLDISNEFRKKIRTERDKKHRARTDESILLQYKNSVNPMYQKYIKPTSKFADIIIKDNNYYNDSFNILSKEIDYILR